MFKGNHLQSRKGSILLLVVVISGFMLVAFSTLSGKIRTQLTNRLASEKLSSELYNELNRVRLTKDMFSIDRVFPNEPRAEVQKRGGILFLESNSGKRIDWSGTGRIQLNIISPNAQICYQNIDSSGSSDEISSCTSTGVVIETSGGSGKLNLSTLGGYAQLNTNGTSSGVLLGIPVYFQVSAPVGNLVIPIATLKTYY